MKPPPMVVDGPTADESLAGPTITVPASTDEPHGVLPSMLWKSSTVSIYQEEFRHGPITLDIAISVPAPTGEPRLPCDKATLAETIASRGYQGHLCGAEDGSPVRHASPGLLKPVYSFSSYEAEQDRPTSMATCLVPPLDELPSTPHGTSFGSEDARSHQVNGSSWIIPTVSSTFTPCWRKAAKIGASPLRIAISSVLSC